MMLCHVTVKTVVYVDLIEVSLNRLLRRAQDLPCAYLDHHKPDVSTTFTLIIMRTSICVVSCKRPSTLQLITQLNATFDIVTKHMHAPFHGHFRASGMLAVCKSTACACIHSMWVPCARQQADHTGSAF